MDVTDQSCQVQAETVSMATQNSGPECSSIASQTFVAVTAYGSTQTVNPAITSHSSQTECLPSCDKESQAQIEPHQTPVVPAVPYSDSASQTENVSVYSHHKVEADVSSNSQVVTVVPTDTSVLDVSEINIQTDVAPLTVGSESVTINLDNLSLSAVSLDSKSQISVSTSSTDLDKGQHEKSGPADNTTDATKRGNITFMSTKADELCVPYATPVNEEQNGTTHTSDKAAVIDTPDDSCIGEQALKECKQTTVVSEGVKNPIDDLITDRTSINNLKAQRLYQNRLIDEETNMQESTVVKNFNRSEEAHELPHAHTYFSQEHSKAPTGNVVPQSVTSVTSEKDWKLDSPRHCFSLSASLRNEERPGQILSESTPYTPDGARERKSDIPVLASRVSPGRAGSKLRLMNQGRKPGMNSSSLYSSDVQDRSGDLSSATSSKKTLEMSPGIPERKGAGTESCGLVSQDNLSQSSIRYCILLCPRYYVLCR